MQKTNKSVRIMCEIGMIAALGFVFDELQSILSRGIFINGGSIGFAMIAVLVMAFRRGWFPALITGLIIGLLDVATSAQIIHPMQLLLDYIFPYAVVGIAGFLKPFFDKYDDKLSRILWLISGTIIGGLMKFLSHYLAGVIFWTDPTYFAWNLNEMNVYLYCFVYNIAFIGPSIIITAILLVILYLTAPRVLIEKDDIISREDIRNNEIQKVISISTLLVGSVLFIYYLIDYIRSYEDNSSPGYIDFDFNPDSMMISMLGLFLIVLGIISVITAYKQKFNSLVFTGSLTAISLISFIYCLARLIRMYVKEQDPSIYWIWFAVGLIFLSISCVLFIFKYLKAKKKSSTI